jgi:hypothetical protein
VKRSELNVGDELLYAKPYDWDSGYTSGGEKAVVVAVEPHKETAGWGFRGGRTYAQVAKGNGVLVDLHRDGQTPSRRVVQLGHLRGPYAQAAAEMESRAKRRQDADDVKRSKRNAADAQARELDERAKAAGLTSVSWSMRWNESDVEFRMSAEAFATLLDALEADHADPR